MSKTVKFGTILCIPLAARGALIKHWIPTEHSYNSKESLPQRIHILVTSAPSKAHFPFCTDFRTKSPQRVCLCWGSQLSQKRKTEIWMQFSIFTTSKLCFIASEQRITIQHRGTGCWPAHVNILTSGTHASAAFLTPLMCAHFLLEPLWMLLN